MRSLYYELHPRYAMRITKVVMIIVLLIALCGGGYVAVAYGYPAVKGSAPVTGAPQNKGEMKAYMSELKAHDDRLRATENQDMALWAKKLAQDNTLEAGVAKMASDCTPCVVFLPAPTPAPAFEPLTELVIPAIAGADDEAVNNDDRAMLDRLETQHDENQNRFARNDEKKWGYLMYIETRIDYYTHPVIKCPEAPPVTEAPPGEYYPPGEYSPPEYYPPEYTPPGAGPIYKLKHPQVNPTNGQSSLVGPADTANSGTGATGGVPPAQQTPVGEEPT